jgi:hypothetical protein
MQKDATDRGKRRFSDALTRFDALADDAFVSVEYHMRIAQSVRGSHDRGRPKA